MQKDDPARAAPPRRGRVLRRLLWLGGILVLFLACAVAAAPTVLSTDWGRSWLFGIASDAIPGRIQGESLDLSWTGGQAVGELQIRDPQGSVVLRCRKIETDLSIWQLVRGNFGPGTLRLERVELDLVVDEQGRLNLGSALAEPTGTPSRSLEETLRELEVQLPESLKVTVDLTDSRVSIRTPDLAKPVVLSGVDGKLVLGARKPAQLSLSAGLAGGARAKLDATLSGFDAKHTLKATECQLGLKLDADFGDDEDLPRALRDALGPAAAATLELAMSPAGAELQLDFTSERVRFAGGIRSPLGGTDRHLVLARPIEANLVLTPALAEGMAAEGVRVALDGDVALNLSLSKLSLPLDAFDPAAVACEGRATLGDGRLSVEFEGGREEFTWRGWNASLAKEPGAETAAFAVEGGVEQGERKGRISVAGRAHGAELRDVSARVEDFPLAPLDRLLETFTERKGLLVEALGPSLDVEANGEPLGEEAVKGRLRVRTERLSLDAPLEVDWGKGVVRGEGIALDYTLSPAFLRSFRPGDGLEPEDDLSVRLRVRSVRAPLTGFDPAQVAMDVRAELGAGRLRGHADLPFRDVAAEVETANLRDALRVKAGGRLGSGEIAVVGALRGLWSADGAFQPDRIDGDLTLEATSLPLAPAGLEKMLGSALSANVTVSGDGREATARVRVETERLGGELSLALAESRVQLAAPAEVRYVLAPDLFATDRWRLGGEVPVTLSLARLSLPVEGLRMDAIAAAGNVRAEGFVVERLPEGDRISVSRLDVSVEGDSLAQARVGLDCTAQADGLPGAALGGPLVVRLRGLLLDEVPAQLEARLESPLLALHAKARREGESIRLEEPMTLKYELRPAVLEKAGWTGVLAKPVPVDCRVARLTVPLDFALSGLSGEAGLSTSEVAFVAQGEPRLKDVRLSLAMDKEIAMTLSAAVAAGGSIAVRGKARSADPEGPLSFVAELENVPVALIESLARSGMDLPTLVGPQASLTLDVDLPNGLKRGAGAVDGRIDLTAKAQHLEVDAHVQAGERIALTRPARVRWTLTPAGALALAPEANFRLARAAAVVLDVGKAVHGDAGTALAATAGVSGLEIVGPKGRIFRLTELKLDLSSPDARETLLVKLDGEVAGSERLGSIRGTVNLENLSGQRASIKTDLSLERVPVGPIDGIMEMEGMLLAFLGPEASARATATVADDAGPVDLKFTSGNLQAVLAGRLTPDAFLLRAPVTAELVLSEQFAKRVLPRMGPFFRGIESTEQPIRLRVESDGFRVPRSLDLAGIAIPSASLDIGRVVLQNQTILQALKKLSRVDLPDRTTAWFTPLRIGMKNGAIRYEKRIDMLFDQQFHLATWGEVNVAGNRVDMVFAVMPETVNQLFRIKSAGANSTLQIPIRGSLDDPKIDVGKAVANIAALRAKEEALKNLPQLGRIIAERALGRLLGDTLSGAPALAASADPLPWEKR